MAVISSLSEIKNMLLNAKTLTESEASGKLVIRERKWKIYTADILGSFINITSLNKYEMIGVLGHDFALIRIYCAGDNLG